MARKPRDFKKEYERRIKNATAKGRTRQQARGHKEAEHIERREREIEERGITGAQEHTIENWYSRTYNPGGSLGRKDLEDVLELAKGEGYDAFKEWRATWEAARRTYQREGSRKDGTGPAYLLDLTLAAGMDDISWLYYH